MCVCVDSGGRVQNQAGVLPVEWKLVRELRRAQVEMRMFAFEHAPPAIANFGLFMYNLVGKWPATRWGTLNSAPTLCFARDHLGSHLEDRLRAVPSGTHEVFDPASEPGERAQTRRTRFGIDDEKTKAALCAMVAYGD